MPYFMGISGIRAIGQGFRYMPRRKGFPRAYTLRFTVSEAEIRTVRLVHAAYRLYTARQEVAERLQVKESQLENAVTERKHLQETIAMQEAKLSEKDVIIEKLTADLTVAKEDVERLHNEMTQHDSYTEQFDRLFHMLDMFDVQKETGAAALNKSIEPRRN